MSHRPYHDISTRQATSSSQIPCLSISIGQAFRMQKCNKQSGEASECQTQIIRKGKRLEERLDNGYLDEKQQVGGRSGKQTNDAVTVGASTQNAVLPQDEVEVTLNIQNKEYDDWRGHPETTAEGQGEDRAVNHHLSSILSTLRWSALRWTKLGISTTLQYFS